MNDNNEFELDDLSTYKNRVRVQKVPFEMEDNVLRSLMERYGRVENINTTYKKYGKFDNILSDERIVWMVVEFPIPSSLYIKETETYVYFSYLQQPMTCHKCGSLLHKVNQCHVFRTVKQRDRDNAVNIEFHEIPEPPENDNMSSHSNELSDERNGNPEPPENDNVSSHSNDLSDDDTDSEFEDSRSVLSNDSDMENDCIDMSMANTIQSVQELTCQGDIIDNSILCPECEYASESRNDLDRHMDSHTDESDSVNDRQQTGSEQHLNTHTGDSMYMNDHQQTDHEQETDTHTGETEVLGDLMHFGDTTSSPKFVFNFTYFILPLVEQYLSTDIEYT